MKILYFMNNTDHGGAALALYDLVQIIKKDYPFIEPIVVTGKKNKLNKKLDMIGVENYHAPFRNFISSYHTPAILWALLYQLRHKIGNLWAVNSLKKKIDFSTIDLIHTNLNRIDIGAILAQKYQIPHVWHIREHLDIFYYSRKIDKIEQPGGLKVLTTEKNIIEYMNSFSSIFVTISNSVTNEWCNRGLDPESMKTIYDGIQIPSPSIRNKRVINGKIRLLFVGGYNPMKGQEDFIDLFSKLPKEVQNKYSVTFYGSGKESYIDKLRSKSKSLELKDFEFHTYVENLTEKLSCFDIGINFSDQEGFGRVTVEYMTQGLCVIATASGATPEIIIHGETGFLINKEDTQEFIDLFTFLSKNKETVRKIGNKAMESVGRFSINAHAENIISLYNDIARKRK